MRFVSWKDYKGELTTDLKVIYTTNAIESLNSMIRHVTNKRKIFPSDDSARKIIYLAVMNASRKWTMPIQNWCEAMNWLMIKFDERFTAHL